MSQEIDWSKVSMDDPEFNKPPQRYRCREGRKVFAVIGMQRGERGRKNTPLIDFEVVCVQDLEPPMEGDDEQPTDVGLTTRITCWMTPRSIGRNLFRLLRVQGVDRELNLTDTEEGNADILQAACSGYFIGTVEHRQGTNRRGKEVVYTSVETDSLEPLGNIQKDPAWSEIANVASEEYTERQAERAEQQDERETRGGSGGGGGRGGYQPDKKFGF